MRVSVLHRDLGHNFGDHGQIERPSTWTGEWVRHRMVEAFAIERRIPDKRIGPAIVKGAWTNIPVTDSFQDRVHQGETPRQEVWDAWARISGATAAEVSRMEEALSWPGLVLSNDHALEGRVLLAWAFCVAYGKPVRALMRKRGWSRTTFYRSVDRGAERIAAWLNKRGVAVR